MSDVKPHTNFQMVEGLTRAPRNKYSGISSKTELHKDQEGECAAIQLVPSSHGVYPKAPPNLNMN